MYRKASVLSVIISLLVLLVSVTPVLAQTPPTVTVSNLPDSDVLVLHVGETHTFEITITSESEFILAQAMLDQYYPGRSVFVNSAHANRDTEATLLLTVTGKVPTADLPDSVAPVTIVTGVRYAGGVVYPSYFEFNIVVVE